MPAIGMFLLWGGYTLGFWGYCRLQGYNITIGELVVPKRYDTTKWPPQLIDDTAVAPNPMGGPGHNGVAPGQHPGDMPYTYPNPNPIV